MLLRGNGTPRSFRVPVPELRRAFFWVGGSILFLFALASTFIGISLYLKKHPIITVEPKVVEAIAPVPVSPGPTDANNPAPDQGKQIAELQTEMAQAKAMANASLGEQAKIVTSLQGDLAKAIADASRSAEGQSREITRLQGELAKTKSDMASSSSEQSLEINRLQGELTKTKSGVSASASEQAREINRLQSELTKARSGANYSSSEQGKEISRLQGELIRVRAEAGNSSAEQTREISLLKSDLAKAKLGGANGVANNNSADQAKEIIRLQAELTKAHTQLEQRQAPVLSGAGGGGDHGALLLEFLDPRNVPVPTNEMIMKIQNPRISRQGSSLTLDFELHNIDPEQKLIKGYFVAFVKSPNFLFVYPAGALNPKESTLLNFGKGDTFAVSRFRAAQAVFRNLPANLIGATYQILLFSPEGKLLDSLSYTEGQ